MACTTAPEAFLPPGKHRWSENICERGVFIVTRNDAGNTVLVSDTPIRAMGFRNGAPCKHHLGRVSRNDRGNTIAWYCGNPHASRYYVSPMLIARNHRGNTVAVGYHKTPIWTELIFYSQDRYCRPPPV